MPILKADLSVSSLESMLYELKSYRQKVADAPHKIVSNLADYGKQQIAQGISNIQDKDGNYLATAKSYVFGNTGFAYMEGDQAAFIEYGTGVVGQSNAHPQANQAGWNYNSGATIKRTGDWSYWDKARRRWVHTKGIPAQMPVLKAALAMRRRIAQAGRDALK